MGQQGSGEHWVTNRTIRGDILLKWSKHPLKETPKRSALVILSMIVFIGLIIWIETTPLLVVLAIFLIVSSTAGYLFPNRYLFTTEGIYYNNIITDSFRSWRRFRRFTVYSDAVYMHFSKRGLRNRIARGILVYFDNNRDDVVRIIEQCKREDAEIVFVDRKEGVR